MRSNGKSSGIVQRDLGEGLKQRVFRGLNELARSRDIAVIFHLMQQKDPATNHCEGSYYSTGPAGRSDMCLFCGWGHKNLKDFVRMGEFVADPWCHYDFVQEGGGVAILDREDHRPDVIILDIWLPGSLDNAILDLAWGLAAHRLCGRSYSISPARLKKETDKQAARLVQTLEVQLGKTVKPRS